MLRKKLFHEGRQPPVILVLDNRILMGRLSGFWESGLEICIPERLAVEPGTHVHHLRFEDEKIPSLKHLQVARADTSEAGTVLELHGREREIQRILHMLREEEAFEDDALDRSRIPRHSRKVHYTKKAIDERLAWVRATSGSGLEHISRTTLDPESLAGNIENYIGAVQIPVGLAGPILVKGTYTDGYVPLPMATTEGALISSLCRGSKACNLAGGVHVHVARQHMVRAPVFFCESMEGAVNLERWVLQHSQAIKAKAESISSYAKLERITPLVFGNALHIEFSFSTGDAAGQNMTSACTWVACEWIAERIKDKPFIGYLWHNVEGNLSGDKKANYQNFIQGRGIGVTATCFVPGRILRRVLRVTPERFVRIWQEGEFAGACLGMMGSNINFANVIAGIFTATGQDIACVHESAGGIFKAAIQGDGLAFTAFLPSLVAGTVGGGTHLPAQKECLEIMGCAGKGKLFRFAEIVAAACLALDISTGAAIVTHDFVSAHERLGRNRPTRRLSWSEINEDFFSELFDEPQLRVTQVEKVPRESCSGILSSVTEKSPGVHGLHRYKLDVETPWGSKTFRTFLKMKVPGRDLEDIGFGIVKLTGEDRLPGLYASQSQIFDLEDSHLREINVYRHGDKALLAHCPRIFGTRVDHHREIYAILMEDLTGSHYYDSIRRLFDWNEASIKAVLRDMAAMHGIYFERYGDLEGMNIRRLDKAFMCPSKEFIRELTRFNALRYPELLPPDIERIYKTFLEDLESQVDRMCSFPMTLTHNDFNPRNLCLREEGTLPRTVLYDWELAFFQNPQHDLIEFLTFVLPEGATREDYIACADYYLKRLQAATARRFSREHFLEVLDLNAIHLALVRMNLYLLGHNVLRFDFLERVYTNLTRYIRSASTIL